MFILIFWQIKKNKKIQNQWGKLLRPVKSFGRTRDKDNQRYILQFFLKFNKLIKLREETQNQFKNIETENNQEARPLYKYKGRNQSKKENKNKDKALNKWLEINPDNY